jgi:DNA processing protein
MIADGVAHLVTNPQDVTRLAEPDGAAPSERATATPRRTDDLDENQRRIYDAVPARGSLTIGEIAFASGRDVSEVRVVLAILETRGLLNTNGSGWTLART